MGRTLPSLPPFLPLQPTTVMDTRQIGSLEVSLVGLGCNNFGWGLDEARSAAVIHAALDAGVTFFDTADIYGATQSEVFLGRALAGRRDSVVIATKFGMKVDDARHGAKPDYVRRAAEDSLRRLGTDRIDLYQLHQPDPTVPVADTLGALDDLVRAGKVREIGCSNFSAAQLREARAAAKRGAAQFVSVQNEYSLFNREPEREVLPECDRLDLAFLPYFPLASGLLTGKYTAKSKFPKNDHRNRWDPKRMENDLKKVDRIRSILQTPRLTLVQAGLEFILSFETVNVVIPGAKRRDQILESLLATEEPKLRIEEISILRNLFEREPLFQTGFFKS